MQTPKRYWFPAKRVGWGWALPRVWQGWVTLVGYAAINALLFHFVPPSRHHAVFFLSLAMATALFVGIVWTKGEPTT